VTRTPIICSPTGAWVLTARLAMGQAGVAKGLACIVAQLPPSQAYEQQQVSGEAIRVKSTLNSGFGPPGEGV